MKKNNYNTPHLEVVRYTKSCMIANSPTDGSFDAHKPVRIE